MRTLAILILFFTLSSCSAGYILKASYKELGILLNRQDIEELTKDPSLDLETKEKLLLVLEVRQFCKEVGLIPKGSFTQYTKIEDDVLVWVLSGSLKHRLVAKTWWFPIVGNIPYKGFFELEDAKEGKKELEQAGYDTFLRSSDAFSTLGWFNDPLLSTVLKRDKLSIVNTVIHEIVHNTIWIKNNAAFNETMANAIANIGTIEFYKNKQDTQMLTKSIESMEKEIAYARLLETTLEELNNLYKDSENLTESLEQNRQIIFENFQNQLQTLSKAKNLANLRVNNAYFLGQATYFNKFNLFIKLHEKQGRSLQNMLTVLNEIKEDSDPYQSIENLLK